MSDLVQRLKAVLPPAQGPAAPQGPRLDIPTGTTSRPRPAAVLVPFICRDCRPGTDEADWRILFTKRTDKVEHHKGQISFPGGGVDPADKSLLAAALRETEEEIGVRPGDVQVLGALPPFVTVTNYQVFPFVGVVPYPYDFRINDFEVDRLLEVPLRKLLAEAGRYDLATTDWLSLTFNHNGDVIWGATARILFHFLSTAFPRTGTVQG